MTKKLQKYSYLSCIFKLTIITVLFFSVNSLLIGCSDRWERYAACVDTLTGEEREWYLECVKRASPCECDYKAYSLFCADNVDNGSSCKQGTSVFTRVAYGMFCLIILVVAWLTITSKRRSVPEPTYKTENIVFCTDCIYYVGYDCTNAEAFRIYAESIDYTQPKIRAYKVRNEEGKSCRFYKHKEES